MLRQPPRNGDGSIKASPHLRDKAAQDRLFPGRAGLLQSAEQIKADRTVRGSTFDSAPAHMHGFVLGDDVQFSNRELVRNDQSKVDKLADQIGLIRRAVQQEEGRRFPPNGNIDTTTNAQRGEPIDNVPGQGMSPFMAGLGVSPFIVNVDQSLQDQGEAIRQQKMSLSPEEQRLFYPQQVSIYSGPPTDFTANSLAALDRHDRLFSMYAFR